MLRKCSVVRCYFGELTMQYSPFQIYVRLEKSIAYLFKIEPDWGGPHICHRELDRLAGYVNDGILQTVVDQVYTPDDAEKAIAHICSAKAIGGTIVTFRS